MVGVRIARQEPWMVGVGAQAIPRRASARTRGLAPWQETAAFAGDLARLPDLVRDDGRTKRSFDRERPKSLRARSPQTSRGGA